MEDDRKVVGSFNSYQSYFICSGNTNNAMTPFIAWIDENSQQSTGYEQDIAASEATYTG